MVGTSPPTKAFDALATCYQSFRPGYPNDAARVVVEFAAKSKNGRGKKNVILDVGSGTGIFTRQLWQEAKSRDLTVVGVEPNADMLAEARRTSSDEAVKFIAGTAEALPANDGAVVGISAAQSAQWFDRVRFYEEARRVLVPGGMIAIVENNRQWAESKFLSAYEDLLEKYSPNYNREYRAINFHDELMASNFIAVDQRQWVWVRDMTRADFLGMSLSSTKIQSAVRILGEDRIRNLIDEVLDRFVDSVGSVEVAYKTELTIGRNRSG